MKNLLLVSLLYGAMSLSPKPYTHKVTHKTISPHSQHMRVSLSHYCTKCGEFFDCVERVPEHKCIANKWHEVSWKCERDHNCKN